MAKSRNGTCLGTGHRDRLGHPRLGTLTVSRFSELLGAVGPANFFRARSFYVALQTALFETTTQLDNLVLPIFVVAALHTPS